MLEGLQKKGGYFLFAVSRSARWGGPQCRKLKSERLRFRLLTEKGCMWVGGCVCVRGGHFLLSVSRSRSNSRNVGLVRWWPSKKKGSFHMYGKRDACSREGVPLAVLTDCVARWLSGLNI